MNTLRKSLQRKSGDCPGLLVSVRSPTEARAALAGGADVIDIKEPAHGPLGAADRPTIKAIIKAVDGRALVTAAMGELLDLHLPEAEAVPAGIALFKLGLAGCGKRSDWHVRWHLAIESLSDNCQYLPRAEPVAVAYADWQLADAPTPQDVLAAARDFSCPALLVDTWNKSDGTLFDHWPEHDVGRFVEQVQAANLTIVLAGALTGASFAKAAQLQPDVVAVRTAACEGGRGGSVTAERVQALKLALRPAGAAFQEFS